MADTDWVAPLDGEKRPLRKAHSDLGAGLGNADIGQAHRRPRDEEGERSSNRMLGKGMRVASLNSTVPRREQFRPVDSIAQAREAKVAGMWDDFVTEVIARRIANHGLGRRILINCGGMVCTTYEKYLRRYPGTLLTDMFTQPIEDNPLASRNFLFLDRHPFACLEIISVYRDEHVPQQPPHISPEVWQNELYYFKMHKSEKPIEGLDKVLGIHAMHDDDDDVDDHIEKGRPPGGYRLTLWLLCEDPKSSNVAWTVSTISLLMVVASVTIVCIETLPELANDPAKIHILDQVDLYIVVFFTIEYITRLVVNTERLHFIKQPLNVIDLVSIIPTWLTLALQGEDFSWGRLLRVLRVLRVFKLARHSGGLQVLAETAIKARNELFQVLFCFSILVILFAAIVYYTEEQDVDGPKFESIPHSMWWAVITLCTIGYGDMYPTSALGQLFGGMACISGVIMVALPISVISSTFQTKYAEHTAKQTLAENRLEMVQGNGSRDEHDGRQRKKKEKAEKAREEEAKKGVPRRGGWPLLTPSIRNLARVGSIRKAARSSLDLGEVNRSGETNNQSVVGGVSNDSVSSPFSISIRD